MSAKIADLTEDGRLAGAEIRENLIFSVANRANPGRCYSVESVLLATASRPE